LTHAPPDVRSELLALPRWPIVLGVIATAIWGVAMRGMLAGLWTVPGDYAQLRHAHSHGGVYLVVFPLCVLAWRHLGVPSVGRRTMVWYYAAGASSIVTFSLAGYSVFSIVASTIVAGGWLLAAYRGRSVLQQQGALRLMPVAFVLVTAFIPPIAILTRRNPAMATMLVHSFLATLFLLIALPAALRRIGAVPLDARMYAPSALLAAAYLGAWPVAIASAGLLGVAALLSWTLLRSPIERAHRLAFLGFVAGSVALVVLGPVSHNTTIGGLHYLLLGPLFMALAPVYGVMAWCIFAAAAAMGASLVGFSWLGPSLAHTIASAAGVAWAAFATIGLVRAWRDTTGRTERAVHGASAVP
jgi:hypothetical protein